MSQCILGQEISWVKSIGGQSFDTTYDLDIDNEGNVYVCGQFSGDVDFDPGLGITLESAGSGADAFILKLNSLGDLQWVKTFGGNETVAAISISLDSFGNIFVTGIFQGTTDLDPNDDILSFTSEGVQDCFIQKFDNDGNLIWAQVFGGPSLDNSESIDVDPIGNIYLNGTFDETVDFDPGSETSFLTALSNSDVFILSLNNDGDFLWAKKAGGTLVESGNSIHVDNESNVYTIGTFEFSADLDPGPEQNNFSSQGVKDVFIQKLDSQGNFIWARTVGGESLDYGTAISTDADGNVYSTGSFWGISHFYSGQEDINLVSSGNSDTFIHKMNSLGEFMWVKQIGGFGYDFPSSICLDTEGNIYVSGRFTSIADFDPNEGVFNLTAVGGTTQGGSVDSYILKLDSDGNFIWANRLGGSGADSGIAVKLDSGGNAYSTGSFQGSIDYETADGPLSIQAQGTTDFFIQKLSNSPTNITASRPEMQFEIYPNPCDGRFTLSTPKPISDIEIVVSDANGKIALRKKLAKMTKEQISLELSPGIYCVTVISNEFQSIKKLVIE